MIGKIWSVPETESSRPFCDAKSHGSLDTERYLETEYFFSGTANLYETDEAGEPRVAYSDVPYTNRMIIRAPKNTADFNGHVVVEILNASARYDIERMWIVSHDYFTRKGIIYVGVTSKPDVFDSLANYDEKRYCEISWPNPRPEEQWITPQKSKGRISFVRKDQECGLFWDILMDVALLLRSDDAGNPIAQYAPRYISLTGWSQSCGYITRFLNSFAYRYESAVPYFDGYFSAGGVYSFSVPMNQNEYYIPKKSWSYVRNIKQPYVMVQTESEKGSLGINTIPRANNDTPGSACRIYEITGLTHDNKTLMNDYYKNDAPLKGVNYPSIYRGKEAVPNDYPGKYAMNAAYDHFFRWIETGIAPANGPMFERDYEGNNVTDAFGNALGGVRTVFVDLPTRRYIPLTTWPDEEGYYQNCMYGHEEPFSPSMLKELYGTLENYRKKATELTNRHILKGYVLREDAEDLINEAVRLAEEAGLR